MEFIKKNITLIIGILIPILMILFIAGSIYLPGLFIQPKFNFLYANYEDYYYGNYQYYVKDGEIVRRETNCLQMPNCTPKDVKLYVYNVVKDKSREISFEEAKKLNLDSSAKSPDGFEIVYGSRGDGFFPFFFYNGTDYGTRYIKGHGVSKKLDMQLSGSYYNNFNFIGWIK